MDGDRWREGGTDGGREGGTEGGRDGRMEGGRDGLREGGEKRKREEGGGCTDNVWCTCILVCILFSLQPTLFNDSVVTPVYSKLFMHTCIHKIHNYNNL